MSASERLAALAATHERVVPIFRRVGADDWQRDRPAESVMDALPEIVAVAHAMERIVEDGTAPITDEIVYVIRASTRDEVKSALTALEEKLKP